MKRRMRKKKKIQKKSRKQNKKNNAKELSGFGFNIPNLTIYKPTNDLKGLQ